MQVTYYSDEDCNFIASKENSMSFFPGCDYLEEESSYYRYFCD